MTIVLSSREVHFSFICEKFWGCGGSMGLLAYFFQNFIEFSGQLAHIGLVTPRGSGSILILNPGSAPRPSALNTRTFSFCVKGCCTSSGRSSPKALCSSHQMEACSFACQLNKNINSIKSRISLLLQIIIFHARSLSRSPHSSNGKKVPAFPSAFPEFPPFFQNENNIFYQPTQQAYILLLIWSKL